MALNPLPFPQLFPNVPYAVGVPSVLRNALNDAFSAANDTAAPATSDGSAVEANQPPIRWGVYTGDGSPAVIGDGCVAFEYTKDYRVSDYPQEDGSFRSYNKVETPFQLRVTIQKSGSSPDRQAFLNSVEAVVADAGTLYEVITADQTYSSLTVTHADYRRTAVSGATLLSVELWCEQIRVTATLALSNTAQPSGASQVNDGSVQPQTPTSGQAALATGIN